MEHLEPILEGASRGERKCQESLYREFYGYGMSICLRYSANRAEAVEILHDGYMKVFKNLRQFDPNNPFIPWFRKILINCSINHYKKNLKYSKEIGLENIPDPPDLQISALSQLEYKDLIKAIQTLPLAYRTVLNLFIIEGYKHSEIAELLNISEGTSKSNLFRAREKLRIILTPENHEKAYLRNE